MGMFIEPVNDSLLELFGCGAELRRSDLCRALPIKPPLNWSLRFDGSDESGCYFRSYRESAKLEPGLSMLFSAVKPA